jgi:hypothetical protein
MLAFLCQTACMVAAVRFSFWLEGKAGRMEWRWPRARRKPAPGTSRQFVEDGLAIDSQLQRAAARRQEVRVPA